MPSDNDLIDQKNNNVSSGRQRTFSGCWKDGLYSVSFCLEGNEADDAGEALAVLRHGELVGSDKHGGVFEGFLSEAPDCEASHVRLRYRVPPGGILVTGRRQGNDEALLDVQGALSECGEGKIGVWDFAGEKLSVRVRYIGTLP